MLMRAFLIIISLFVVTGCSNSDITESWLAEPPEITPETQTGRILRSIPAAKQRASVAVYEFSDQTGQHKPSDRLAEFSRAVTQGGAAILNQALVKTGEGSWFTVVERKGLDNLLKERQIISATREMYTGKKSKLPPMLYAGVLLEGGIISYESNTNTGGLGARYLGIGGDSEYRQDVVTIYLRAVNVQNGEVLASVDTSKTIFSASVQGSLFKYVAFDEILELESGFTVNEPPQMAVRQAIESAVYALVMEGAMKGLWEFADELEGRLAMQRYVARVNGDELPSRQDVAPVQIIRPGDAISSNVRQPRMQPPVQKMSPRAPVNTAAPRVFVPDPKGVNVPMSGPLPTTRYQPAAIPAAPVTSHRVRNFKQISPNANPRTQPPAELTREGNTRQNGARASARGATLQRPFSGDPTQVYCTSAGCFPFPPNGR